jgi:hypothetical protein
MAKVAPLQTQWDRGMNRDKARQSLPQGSLWNSVDMIASYGAPMRQRGGWVNHSQSVSSITATASYIKGGVYATFATSGGGETTKNLALDEDGLLYDVTTANAASAVSAAVTVIQNPVFHGGTAASAATAVFTGLVIIPDGTGAAVPKRYDGTTLADLKGSPPKARFATVHKDYTVLGNGTVGSTYYPDRIWFSPEGDPDCAVSAVTAWDTTDAWIGFSRHVTGLGSTRNALMVFHDNAITRIRGSIPPPDEDMIVDDGYFDVGLVDPLSIAPHRDHIIWASPEGIFRTDGAILDDLTRRGGMLRYWLDTTTDATSAWSFAGATIRDNYVLTIMNGTEFVDCFVIDLLNVAWTRLSNVDATSMWQGQLNAADELYWGRRNGSTVARLSTIYAVGDSDYKLDGDGDSIFPVVETAYFTGRESGPKRLRRAYLSYELTDYDVDNPLCTMSYILTPEETSYTNAASLAETDAMLRERFHIDKQAQGIAFKFERSFAGTDTGAGDFLLHSLELEATPYEQSRRIS